MYETFQEFKNEGKKDTRQKKKNQQTLQCINIHCPICSLPIWKRLILKSSTYPRTDHLKTFNMLPISLRLPLGFIP